MKIAKFNISNFKGIKQSSVEITSRSPGNIVTLIGLNESGKTTVLEAISNFVSVDEDTFSIVQTISPDQKPIDLIPKSKKSNFTGQISIEAIVELEDDDIDALERHIRIIKNAILQKDTIPRTFSVNRVFIFKDSDLQDTKTYWSFSPQFIKKNGTKIYTASGGGPHSDIWMSAIAFLRQRFPKIVYFPTFLFNVPNKIYLDNEMDWASQEEKVTNDYFKQVLQDVADSIDEDIDIQKHIVKRVKRHKEEYSSPFEFFAAFMGFDEASQIRAVVNKLSGEITRTVFTAWNQIFDHNVTNKQVRIDWSLDTERNNAPFLSLQIYDGEQNYAIHERSLGFRWFFTFLLFTQFRKSRKGERATIFLFDEPASNLHARAQTKLLESFGKTARSDQYIIYSTHSHYMIDPIWLEKAYIVENKGIDFESEEAAARFEIRDTDITLTGYRDFVGQYPERVSYFQPALDALKHSFGPLVPGKYAVIVEGKYDFHPLAYFQERFGLLKHVKIFPAPSASEAGTLISLFRGLGTKFVVLLDDDTAGRRAAEAYRDHHLLAASQVMTLGELDSKLRGKAFETLYSDQVRNLAHEGRSRKIKKADFSHLFLRLQINGQYNVGLGTTTNRVKAIMEKIGARLDAVPEPKLKPKPRSTRAKAKPK